MAEFTVSGESIEEVANLSAQLRRGERLAESDLERVFSRLIEVKETTERLTAEGDSVPRAQIEEETQYDKVLKELQLLQAHGFVSSGGQGGNWRYVGE